MKNSEISTSVSITTTLQTLKHAVRVCNELDQYIS